MCKYFLLSRTTLYLISVAFKTKKNQIKIYGFSGVYVFLNITRTHQLISVFFFFFKACLVLLKI